MGNFFKRFGTFLLGMIFMLVVEVGAIFGLGFYAFTGLTLENLGVTNDGKLENGIDLGNFSTYSLDKLVKYISNAKTHPDEFTLEMLKEEGFDIIETLKILDVDVDSADSRDIQAIKDINLLQLFSENALDTIDFGVILTFIGKDDSGKYPLLSDSLRELLRNNSLGELFENNDSTNTMNLFEVIKPAKLGSILPQTFEETHDGVEYVYTCDSPALELVGNLPLEFVCKIVETKTVDFGYELNEGTLTKLGNLKVSELIAKLSCQTKDNYDKTLEMYEDYSDKTLKEIFVKNESDVYELSLDPLLDDITLGSLFSMYKCTSTDSCKAHDSLSNCNGKWYSKTDDGSTIIYEVIDDSTLNGKIMGNLYNMTVNNLLKGEFDLSLLCDGVYLGCAFGNEIIDKAGYCQSDCNHDGHDANYMWVDNSNAEVSKLINKLSNLSLKDAMDGKLDLNTIFDGLKVGELMNYEHRTDGWYEKIACDNSGTTCPAHKGSVACDNNAVYVKLDSATLGDEISVNLYDLELSQLLNGGFDINNLLKGAYLGKALGYTSVNKAGYCDVDCDHVGHTANYYWVNSSNVYVNDLFNAISNLTLEDAMNGTLDIQTIVNTIKIGSILGYIYDTANSKWTDINGNDIQVVSAMDKILYNLYPYTLNDLSSGSLQLNLLVGGIKIGEFMGYEYKDADNYWYNGVDKVSLIENLFADTLLTDLIDGNSFEDIFGDVYIYELVGHEKIDAKGTLCKEECPSGVHYHDSNGDLVDAVNSAINDMSLTEIINGNLNIKARINDLYLRDVVNCAGTPLLEALQDYQIKHLPARIDLLKLGDIISIDEKTSIGILKVLKDKQLTSLDTELKTIKLGQVLGYEYNGTTWKKVTYTDCTSTCPTDCDGLHKTYSDVDRLGLKLADMTLEQFSKEGLDVSKFTLGDIYTTENLESGIFSTLDTSKDGGGNYTLEEIPISEIPVRLVKGIKMATCADLQYHDIVDFNEIPEGETYSIAQILNMKFTSEGVDWTTFTISQLLSELIYGSI